MPVQLFNVILGTYLTVVLFILAKSSRNGFFIPAGGDEESRDRAAITNRRISRIANLCGIVSSVITLFIFLEKGNAKHPPVVTSIGAKVLHAATKQAHIKMAGGFCQACYKRVFI